MRTKPARAYMHEHEHRSYGIYHWFKTNGIKDMDLIYEICGSFAIEYRFIWKKQGDNHKNFIKFLHCRFETLCRYALLEWNMYFPNTQPNRK
jgi:hypothetical protein